MAEVGAQQGALISPAPDPAQGALAGGDAKHLGQWAAVGWGSAGGWGGEADQRSSPPSIKAVIRTSSSLPAR